MDEMDEWSEETIDKLEDFANSVAEAMEDAAAGAEGENDADINNALDVAVLDREARDNGERPADEWTRRDFRNLLRHHSELRELSTTELRALFLIPTRTVGGVLYCRRDDVRESRRRRRQGEKPFYELDMSPAARWAAGHAYPGARQWLEDEKRKLDEIWERL